MPITVSTQAGTHLFVRPEETVTITIPEISWRGRIKLAWLALTGQDFHLIDKSVPRTKED